MRLIDQVLEQIPNDIFTDVELAVLCVGTPNARHARVKRALAQGELIHIRRGLYGVAPRYRRQPLSTWSLALRIFAPSCVSLESALTYHGLIPEAVYSTTCVTSRRAAEFDTPLGRFVYSQVPAKVVLLGADRKIESDQVFHMASPLRALCDYVYLRNLASASLPWLAEHLRLDEDELRKIRPEDIAELQSYPSPKVRDFLQSCEMELIR